MWGRARFLRDDEGFRVSRDLASGLWGVFVEAGSFAPEPKVCPVSIENKHINGNPANARANPQTGTLFRWLV